MNFLITIFFSFIYKNTGIGFFNNSRCSYIFIGFNHIIPFSTKKLFGSITFFFLLFASTLQAQTITGQVVGDTSASPLTGVNVFIDGTNQGTITDENGQFSLKIERFPVAITFSYLGYQSKTVTLTILPEVPLSIFLNKKDLFLSEITVTDKIKIDTVYDTDYSVVDYEFYDKALILLIFKNSIDKYSLLVLKENGQQGHELPLKDYQPEKLYKSCLGGIYLLTSVNAWQIYLSEQERLQLAHRTPILEFEALFFDCVGANKDWVYFAQDLHANQMRHYYAFPRSGSREIRHILTIADFKKVMQLEDEYRFQTLRAYVAEAHKNGSVEESVYPSNKVPPNMKMEDAAFVNRVIYPPIFVPLFVTDEELVVFDHANSLLTKVSNDGDNRQSIDIAYHKDKKWKKQIIFDDLTERAFTLYDTKWGLALAEINLESGETLKPKELDRSFIDNIKVHNGFVYFTFSNPLKNDTSRRLEKIRL